MGSMRPRRRPTLKGAAYGIFSPTFATRISESERCKDTLFFVSRHPETRSVRSLRRSATANGEISLNGRRLTTGAHNNEKGSAFLGNGRRLPGNVGGGEENCLATPLIVIKTRRRCELEATPPTLHCFRRPLPGTQRAKEVLFRESGRKEHHAHVST